MSRWTERVQQHRIWDILKAFGAQIDQAIAQPKLEAQVIDDIERLRAVLAFTGKRIDAADRQLLHLGPLEKIATAVESASAGLAAFIENGETQHVDEANSNIDQVLEFLSEIVVHTTSEEAGELARAAASYRTAMEQNLNDFDTHCKELANSVAALESTVAEQRGAIDAEKQRLASIADQHQAAFDTAQENRTTEANSVLTTHQNSLGDLVIEYSQKLAEQAASIDALKFATSERLNKLLDELQREFDGDATKILNSMEAKKAEVDKLAGVVGNVAVTSGYLKNANYARRLTWLWHFVALSAFVGLIGAAWYMVVHAKELTSWTIFASRAFVAVAVGALAAYATKQGDKYLEIERRHRRLALELEAIGPYLAPLNEEQQNDFRLKLADLTFGKDELPVKSAERKAPLENDFKQTTDLLLEFMKAVKALNQ